MKVLVVGCNGQLGKSIKELTDTIKVNNEYIFASHNDLDITDEKQVSDYLENNNIDVVINCAAYTNVGKAEEDYQNAYKVNVIGSKNLAIGCFKGSRELIHVSTDYVYHGNKTSPYKENEGLSPLNMYGETKLKGEDEIVKSGCNYVILRTSWLYSNFGVNFVSKIIEKITNKEHLNVSIDQVGTPTYATDLAIAILMIVENKKYINNNGIYNFSNEGTATWFDFAKEIARIIGKNNAIIDPIYESKGNVKRPNYSVMDKRKFKETFKLNIQYWKDALNDCISHTYPIYFN